MGLFPSSAANTDFKNATIHLRAHDATLRVAGAGVNGRILLLGSNNAERVHLDGSSGSITAAGSVTAAGTIATKDNLIHQQITERSRAVGLANQKIDLFPLAQDGAYIVELAASYSGAALGGPLWGSIYMSWSVFTYKNQINGSQFTATLLNQGGIGKQGSDGEGPFWVPDPNVSEAGGNVTLSIFDLNLNNPALAKGAATLSVKALYGKLLSF